METGNRRGKSLHQPKAKTSLPKAKEPATAPAPGLPCTSTRPVIHHSAGHWTIARAAHTPSPDHHFQPALSTASIHQPSTIDNRHEHNHIPPPRGLPSIWTQASSQCSSSSLSSPDPQARHIAQVTAINDVDADDCHCDHPSLFALPASSSPPLSILCFKPGQRLLASFNYQCQQ